MIKTEYSYYVVFSFTNKLGSGIGSAGYITYRPMTQEDINKLCLSLIYKMGYDSVIVVWFYRLSVKLKIELPRLFRRSVKE